MHKFLVKLFGIKEPEVFTISMGAVPAWLNDREKTARSALLAETGETQRKIHDAILNLQQITNTVAQAEQDEELHPKLKSIARNSDTFRLPWAAPIRTSILPPITGKPKRSRH